MKKVYIETYGCQMNVNDSEVVLSILEGEGYALTEEMGEADLILANTCSIRDNAEQRVWGRIDRFRLEKKARPGVLVGILGCMAERLGEKLLASGVVDIVAGPDAYRSLPALVAKAAAGTPCLDTTLSRTETYAELVPSRMDKKGVSAYISIMRGRNNVCGYCVGRYARGAERSGEPLSLVREACDLFNRGYKEVSLLGQNVDSYLWKGEDGETVDFADLLEMVAAVSPDLRVRFSTSYPSDITDKVLYTMASHENICRHIHLPVQSGSNAMLEKMRRKYTREWYLERVARIREIMPDCGLTTDVIAGFCGETEEDHKDTLSLMETVVFDSAFMFQYSERPGTLSAKKYEDDVPPKVKTARLNEIIALQGRMSEKSYAAEVGRLHKVLVEGPSKRNPDELCGRAGNYKMCVFPGEGRKTGDYVTVRVVDSTPATLICRIEEQ
ncbi:MAG: tRNA (N6-isopentenyl adenosine(37)-C2)-methylthiotransferase MiaB [Bacteroidales bacterium]|nr:tRNA (N6-isopentenyl adenosine(37)-C2)-methylthiotransferase MiaB [Bacteroidales bacterium]